MLNTIPRAYKKAMLMSMDICIFALGIWAAYAVRTTTTLPEFNDNYLKLLGIVTLARIPVFIKLGLYRSFLRFPSERISSISAQGVAISTIFVGTALYLWDPQGEPRSVLFIEPFISFFLVLSSRQFTVVTGWFVGVKVQAMVGM